jgi:hypothetical protein
MVGTISLNVMHAHMPGIQHAITNKGNFLPMCERPNYLNGGWFFRLPIRQTPAENFGKGLPALGWFLVERRTGCAIFLNKGTALLRGFAAKQIIERLKHICCVGRECMEGTTELNWKFYGAFVRNILSKVGWLSRRTRSVDLQSSNSGQIFPHPVRPRRGPSYFSAIRGSFLRCCSLLAIDRQRLYSSGQCGACDR